MNKFRVFLIIVCVLLLIGVSATCTACAGSNNIGYNKQLFDLNQRYTHAYLRVGDSWVDVEIKTWKDYEGEQIQIILMDDSVLLVSSVNCILYTGNLPINK